jgi:hypothetical protein
MNRKIGISIISVFCLFTAYLGNLALHPQVSWQYRLFYIEKTLGIWNYSGQLVIDCKKSNLISNFERFKSSDGWETFKSSRNAISSDSKLYFTLRNCSGYYMSLKFASDSNFQTALKILMTVGSRSEMNYAAKMSGSTATLFLSEDKQRQSEENVVLNFKNDRIYTRNHKHPPYILESLQFDK